MSTSGRRKGIAEAGRSLELAGFKRLPLEIPLYRSRRRCSILGIEIIEIVTARLNHVRDGRLKIERTTDMRKPSIQSLFAAAAVLGTSTTPASAEPSEHKGKVDVGFIEIDKDITLRRMVVHQFEVERHCPLSARISRDLVRVERHFDCARRRLRSACLRLARIWPVIEAGCREVLLCAEGLCGRAAEVHREGRRRSIESRDLRHGYRRSARTASCPERTGHREKHHRRRFRTIQQARIYVREFAKPEGRAGGFQDPRVHEQDQRRDTRECVQAGPVEGRAVRSPGRRKGGHVPWLEPWRA